MPSQPADRVPAPIRLWSLREDVLVENGPDGRHLVAVTQWGEITIDDTSEQVCESLRRMSLGPVSVENLPTMQEGYRLPQGEQADGSAEPWQRLLRVLDQLGSCVVQSLGFDDEAGPVLSVAPVSRQAGFWLPPQIAPDQPLKMSRYGAIQASRAGLVLESPTTHHRVVLHRPLAAWVAASLGRATTVAELSVLLNIAEPVLADIAAYLVASGVVLVGEPGTPPRFPEDDDPDLVPWSFHDLQFHASSRMGRHNGPAGAAFPPSDRIPPAPVTKARPVGPRFRLYRPAMTDLLAGDPPLTEVIEVGRSYRDYSERPISAEDLGELLFRASRIRSIEAGLAAAEGSDTTSDRPYPGTANLSELELYLSLDRCTGLPRGNYHYDPHDHALTMVSDSEPEVGELLDIAKVAAGSIRRPPALITLTTRIARLSWIYSGTAYAATLRHAGALQQTLHLVATAMGLASTALAVEDGAALDRALRLDWPTEVSVGDFIIGVRS
jgi:SagB-type dehydrogenase family enzyme